ncbi:hypothetical protein HMP09_1893 [Sphingomonas sp. HMP9]|nr:hypothetical protein HMP09_1893 [Sphingomonas sp. HMP9]
MESERKAILSAARVGFDDDRDLVLLARVLSIVHPKLATAGDTIALLPHVRPPYLSAFQIFCLKLLAGMTIAELPGALRAVAEVATGVSWQEGELDTIVLITSGIAKRAFCHLEIPDVREALTAMLVAIPDHHRWVFWSDTLHNRGMPTEATDDLRRALIAQIASIAPDETISKRLLEAAFLVCDHDLEWLVGQAVAVAPGLPKVIFATLASELAKKRNRRRPLSTLRTAGLNLQGAREVLACATQMPEDFDRWRPPRWFTEEAKESSGPVDSDDDQQDSDEGSILDASMDARLQQLRLIDPGRGRATAVPPQTLLKLAEDAEARLVRNSRDLSKVVLESLARAQRRLKGQTPLVRALWNEGPELSTPKNENFLSDFIADHLRQDLAGRSIAADREVEIRPRVAATQGQRTDIQIRAFAPSTFAHGRSLVAAMTIEVKGCWNPDLFRAMRDQLTDRYLATTGDMAGLYLVGWYVCDSWFKAEVGGRVEHDTGACASVEARLRRQALSLSSEEREVHVFILDATLS